MDAGIPIGAGCTVAYAGVAWCCRPASCCGGCPNIHGAVDVVVVVELVECWCCDGCLRCCGCGAGKFQGWYPWFAVCAAWAGRCDLRRLGCEPAGKCA